MWCAQICVCMCVYDFIVTSETMNVKELCKFLDLSAYSCISITLS